MQLSLNIQKYHEYVRVHWSSKIVTDKKMLYCKLYVSLPPKIVHEYVLFKFDKVHQDNAE